MCGGTRTPVTGPAGTGPRIVCLRFRLRKFVDIPNGLGACLPKAACPGPRAGPWPGSEVCRDDLEQVVVVIDDIVPGHTGKGPDFRLAEMNVRDYPGIYHMVQIQPEDWHLLPEVPPGKDSVGTPAARSQPSGRPSPGT